MNYTEILVGLLAFLGGSGFYRLMTMRAQRRKTANQVASEEYSSMQEIVTNFSNTLAEMGDKQAELTRRNLELERIIAELEREKKGNS